MLFGIIHFWLFFLHLAFSSSLLLPSLPSSFSPPPLLLSLPRQKSLPAMRTLWNRAATCTSTTFHRSDARHHSLKSCTLIAQLRTCRTFLLLQFSAAASFRILIQKSVTTYKSIFRFQNLEEFFRYKSLNLVICPFQVPTATSQHMDDLFDILIESGGKEVHKHSTEPERCI